MGTTSTKNLLAMWILFGAVLLSVAAATVQASEAGVAENGGMSPELVEALMALNLDKDQRAPFAAELRKFSTDLQSGISRISRKRNPDQPRAIKRKTRSLTKKMDKAMRKILREDQWPAYEAYKTRFATAPQLGSESGNANAGFTAPARGY